MLIVRSRLLEGIPWASCYCEQSPSSAVRLPPSRRNLAWMVVICLANTIHESAVRRSDWLSGYACETSRWLASWTVGPSSSPFNNLCAFQWAEAMHARQTCVVSMHVRRHSPCHACKNQHQCSALSSQLSSQTSQVG
jgi:hypothetical protein